MEMNDAVIVLDRLFKQVATSREAFLDRAQCEWAAYRKKHGRKRPADANPSDKDAERRMALLNEASLFVQENLRRDSKLPAADYDHAIGLLDQLDEMRKSAMMPHPHPTILRIRADLALHRKNFDGCLAILNETVDVCRTFETKLQLRDVLDHRCQRVRALYCNSKFGEAVDESDAILLEARKIDSGWESDAMKTACNLSSKWTPIIVNAFFVSCDARLHHHSWDADKNIAEEFTHRWNEAMRNHNAPLSWQPPLQIAAISDLVWCERARDYIQIIARDLYIDGAATPLASWSRHVRCWWSGFGIHLPKTVIAPTIAALLLLALTPESYSKSAKVSEAIHVVKTMDLRNVFQSPGEAKATLEFIEATLGDNSANSLHEVVEPILCQALCENRPDTLSRISSVLMSDNSSEKI